MSKHRLLIRGESCSVEAFIKPACNHRKKPGSNDFFTYSVFWAFSAGIPSRCLGLVAMVIVRTHLEFVTMAIGLLMSCLMCTASLRSLEVGLQSCRHRLGVSGAWTLSGKWGVL